MRGIHVFVAFIIALILMSGIYFGAWQYSMSRVTANLPDILQKTMPGKVKYSYLESSFNPFNAKIIVKDASLVLTDNNSGSIVVVKLGDVPIETDPFTLKKIKVTLPENIAVITTYKGRSHDYNLSLIEPSLELTKTGSDYDVMTSVSGMIIKGRNNGFFSSFIKTGYSYISKNNFTNEWSFLFNNLDLNSIEHFKKWPLITSVSLTWEPMGIENFPLSYIISSSCSKDKVSFDSMIMDYMKKLAEVSKLNITEGRLMLADKWFAFNGEIALDKDLVLTGQGNLSSNKFTDMLATIKDIMGGFPIALDNMMKRIDNGENKTQSISVSADKRILYINGAPVGKLDTMPELIHLHGREGR